MPDPQVTRIDHCSLIVADAEKSLHLYCDLLGLQRDDSRPELGYPGAWLKVGDQQIHLLELPNPDAIDGRPDHGGRDRHVAFRVSDLDELLERLESAGFPSTRSKSGRRAAFCRDIDGNAIELIEE